MGKIVPFAKKRRANQRQLPISYRIEKQRSPSPLLLIAMGLSVGAGIGGGIILWPHLSSRGADEPVFQAEFGFCHTGGGQNCVVDGDTFWLGGEKIRVSDIDTPETHPARCPSEAELGERATARLQELLNAGPFHMEAGDSDLDHYGRKLRIVMRDGKSLGAILVDEGLARHWTGSRQPWC